MTKKEKIDLTFRIENEGFDYAFQHYSDFKEIKDNKFHELRKAYLKAAKELEDYALIDLDELTDEELEGCE